MFSHPAGPCCVGDPGRRLLWGFLATGAAYLLLILDLGAKITTKEK
jgi:hypothetical protein